MSFENEDGVTLAGLMDVSVGSAVSMDGKPFCAVACLGQHEDETRVMLRGQLGVDEVRVMALGWLAAAEAAEQDAMVYRLLTEEMDLEPAHAAGTIAMLRTMRAQEPMSA